MKGSARKPPPGKDSHLKSATSDNKRRVTRISLPTKDLTGSKSPPNDETPLPEQELWWHSREDRIGSQLSRRNTSQILSGPT